MLAGGRGTAIEDPGYIAYADLDRDGDIDSTDYSIATTEGTHTARPEGALTDPGVDNIFGYSGYIYNPTTKLYCLRLRWYSTDLGRFIERDPLGYVDGMNVYQYVRGLPLVRSDPFGQLGLIGGVVGAIGGAIIGGGVEIIRGAVNGEIDWKAVGASAVGGAVAGAIVGATGGLAVAVGASVSTAAGWSITIGAGAVGGYLDSFISQVLYAVMNGESWNSAIANVSIRDMLLSLLTGGVLGGWAGRFDGLIRRCVSNGAITRCIGSWRLNWVSQELIEAGASDAQLDATRALIVDDIVSALRQLHRDMLRIEAAKEVSTGALDSGIRFANGDPSCD